MISHEKLQILISKASKYKTRKQFEQNDATTYVTARRYNVLNQVCQHMLPQRYSTPQLVCKHLLEELLQQTAEYNTRKIISPYELDIYFTNLKVAIEFQGKFWHNKPEVILRDRIKKDLCQKNGILLLYINESKKEFGSALIKTMKQNIIILLPCINLWLKTNLIEKQINDITVNMTTIYNSLFNINDAKEKVKLCKTIPEFRTQFPKTYGRLFRLNLLHLLNPLRKKTIYTKDWLLEQCKNYHTILDFYNNTKLYGACWRRKLLNEAFKIIEESKENVSK